LLYNVMTQRRSFNKSEIEEEKKKKIKEKEEKE
jgi:hypothetical protein